MKKIMRNFTIFFPLLVLMIVTGSCKKNYTDPTAATEDQVFNSPKGLTGVSIGLQRIYTAGRASSLYNRITTDGFLTNQLNILNQGNTSEYQLFQGGNFVDGTNSIIAGLWTSSNKIIYDADLVLLNAEKITDKSFASGLIGYTTIFKALALGDLSMFWDSIPKAIGNHTTFVNRMEGYNMAIAAIDKALSAISANPISASFLSNIPAGIDIVNTLRALKARYSLFTGNYTEALASANAVDLTKTSVFSFNTVNLNPIFETSTSTNNVYQPLDSTMGLPEGFQPGASDKRVPFYIAINPTTSPRFRINGFGATSTAAFPVYLPGEMTLIKAEALARQATPDLANALVELNKVVTKKPASDPYGVGADLPPVTGPLTQAELLAKIYQQRAIELYMSGLRLEDMRRFGRPNSERKRNYLPFPFQERDNNPNTPKDPTF
jgi:starch-binding outer membrane protein, SusD/RagB family